MNSVIIKEENKEEFEWIPAVFEETVSTPNGVKSPILLNESTKASTTEVQTITSRKKTNAQRCREYRERKKLQNTMVQNITAERSDKCSETDHLPAKKPKTNAERRKKHYEAQKLKKQKSKKIPKTAKQRSKEYYYRKKKIQALNTLNHHSDARKQKCLWLLKALAEENGGVLPKLLPRCKMPSKDSSENNDSSLTISKTDINLEKCRQKDNTDLENQESKASESTKASTTQVQTIKSRKKTNAQRCREYRERKKLQNIMVPNITAERSDKCSETDDFPAKKPKTNAERRKKHYEAQKLKKQESKKIPKTAKQRSKEYYYRKKNIQALNTLNHHSDARKQKCLWLLKALAEENGGVLPKLLPRCKMPSKDSSENNDSSLTISKTDINLEKCRQKDNTDLENQESKARTRRKAIPADKEYNIYIRQLEKMAQSCFVLDGQNEFTKFSLELNAKYDDDKSCLEMNAKEDDAKSCFELNAKEDDAKSCLEMNATQGDAKSCFEKNVSQDTEFDDNGKEIKIEPYEMKNEIEDFVPHIVKLEIIECEETKTGGITSQAAAVEMMKVENIKEENIEL